MNPADEARVRELLAATRHDEGLPDDVAARLDRTLAELNAERATDPGVVPGDELASRRRRRRGGALLAAAAVIVVGGVAVGQVLQPRGADDAGGGAASRAESRDTFESGDAAGGAAEDAEGSAPSATSGGPNTLQGPTSAPPEVVPEPLGRPVRLRSDTFADDVRRIAARRLHSPRAPVASTRDSACPGGDYGTGVLLPARYDGLPAVLAFRPPAGDSRVAELLSCGTGDVVRSVTVPED